MILFIIVSGARICNADSFWSLVRATEGARVKCLGYLFFGELTVLVLRQWVPDCYNIFSERKGISFFSAIRRCCATVCFVSFSFFARPSRFIFLGKLK